MRAGQAATISVLTATVAVSTRAVALSTPKDAGGGDKATLRADKRALRKAVSVDLSGLSKESIQGQTAAVIRHLEKLPEFTTKMDSRGMISVYLPMVDGKEVDTWPIIQRLFEQRTRVVVPKIEGKKSGDMAMVLAPSAQSLADLPLDKWNIPIPDESWSSELAGIDLVFVPCVAVDKKCNRLGHGKG